MNKKHISKMSISIFVFMLCSLLLLSGCGKKTAEPATETGSTVQTVENTPAPATPEPEPVGSMTVEFVDWDGKILKTQKVAGGQSAEPPELPAREGYFFTGWSGNYVKPAISQRIYAQYEPDTEGLPTIVAKTVSAEAGSKKVEMELTLYNNPGILGMAFAVNFDESVMTLKKASGGDALSALTFCPPGVLKSGLSYSWDAVELKDGDVKNGKALTLEFDISDNAPHGTYPIVITFGDYSAFDNDLQYLTVNTINGKIIL